MCSLGWGNLVAFARGQGIRLQIFEKSQIPTLCPAEPPPPPPPRRHYIDRCMTALIPRVVVSSWILGGEKDRFCCLLFIVLWSYGRKICLNMCHGNPRNSYDCSYLLRICFICGTNVNVLRCWIPLQVVDREQGAFWFTNKRVQIKILSTLKLVSFESLAGNDFSERGTQADSNSNIYPPW